jgi:hypothetical protein
MRIAALELLFSLDSSTNYDFSRDTLVTFLNDSDGRVRSTALRLLRESLLKLRPRTIKANTNSMDSIESEGSDDTESLVQKKLFDLAVAALTDDSQEVQLESVRMLWTLANQRGDSMVEEAFRKICNMVSDVSIRVRAEACGLLGTLKGVSTKLLLQSLSKNMLKVGVEAFGGGKAAIKEDFQDPSAEGATTIVSKFSDSKNKLIDSSANGAFVHGLEDEFKEVRDAALSSICELSHISRKFAISATEFFVDMFNDEIDSVRVNAIQSLSAIGKVIFLTEAQLLVVLAMLDDANLDVRNASRKLLQNIRLINATSLLTTTTALIASLLKHFIEKEMILPTYSALGRNHPHFVELLLEDLIKLDTRFLMREPRLDDINYLCIAVLILNAAKENANLIELLPPFFNRHYLFLKRHYPLLVPDVPLLEANISQRLLKQKSVVSDQVLAGVASVSSDFRKTGLHFNTGSSPGFNTDFGFLKHSSVSARCLGSNSSKKPQRDEFSLETLLQCLQAILLDASCCDSVNGTQASSDLLTRALSLKSDAAFLKSPETTARFYLEFLELVCLVIEFPAYHPASNQHKIINLAYSLEQTYIGLTPSMIHFLRDLRTSYSHPVPESPAQQLSLIPSIDGALRKHSLKSTSGVILSPGYGDSSSLSQQSASSTSSTKDFYLNLPLVIHFEADISNICDVGGLHVEFSCKTPQFSEIHALRPSSFSKTGALSYRVCADITVTHRRWEANKSLQLTVKMLKRSGSAVCELAAPVSLVLLPKTR